MFTDNSWAGHDISTAQTTRQIWYDWLIIIICYILLILKLIIKYTIIKTAQNNNNTCFWCWKLLESSVKVSNFRHSAAAPELSTYLLYNTLEFRSQLVLRPESVLTLLITILLVQRVLLYILHTSTQFYSICNLIRDTDLQITTCWHIVSSLIAKHFPQCYAVSGVNVAFNTAPLQ